MTTNIMLTIRGAIMFKNLLSLLDTGSFIEILTIIDTTLENEALRGKMLILFCGGEK